MSLQFILGAPGTGKTTYCLQEIERHIPDTAPLYYLVPEQFSLQSERLLLTRRHATMRVQVLSFNRLAYRLFSALGGPPGKMADDLAKAMLLRKILFENAQTLLYYKSAHDKHGFVASLAHTLTELNHYCITANDLLDRAATTPEEEGGTLQAKLTDLALILTQYRKTINGEYLLTDDMLTLLVQRLQAHTGALPLLDNAVFYVDGFSGFTPQERRVLVQLLSYTAYMGITLTTRDTPSFTDPLCAVPRRTQAQLTKQVQQAGIAVLPAIYRKENFRHAPRSGLAFFVENYQQKITALCAHTIHDIEIINAADPYAAVLSAAGRIHAWVQEDNYQFRDIAILCGDRKRVGAAVNARGRDGVAGIVGEG
jgi:ATP-dependent helicase/nuclease subunit B